MTSIFVAFPSDRADLRETVHNASTRLATQFGLDVLPWTLLHPSGNSIISRICQEIAKRDLFICDLTDLNANVLFELGFAIAQKKRIWPLLNTSVAGSQDYHHKLSLIRGIGYVPYTNTEHVVDAFASDAPHLTLEDTIYANTIHETVLRASEVKAIFYLKSPIETDASIRLARLIDNSGLPYWMDDPSELVAPTLPTLANTVYNSSSVIAHFLSPGQPGANLHNAKLSFVAGLAFGFGKNVLMLAHDPYEQAPFDYQDILHVHKTAEECHTIAAPWIELQKDPYISLVQRQRSMRASGAKELKRLQRINLGEPVSENEPEQLSQYFVETSEFWEGMEARHAVFIGRKGTGKTANFMMLRQQLSTDKRNHVCVIKPVSYEFHGLVRLLQLSLPKSEKGFLIESLWKFLIYSELVASVHDKIASTPSYLGLTHLEQEFLAYFDEHKTILQPEFSIRLENAVSQLLTLSPEAPVPEQRLKVSEFLHSNILAQARALIGKILKSKSRVIVLVDNLDKGWTREANLEMLGEILYRLLSVSQSITRDFDRADHWRDPVNLSVVLFLRSDIFDQIHGRANEPDKITPKRITWADPELLIRVIEERFAHTGPSVKTPDDIWSTYFPEKVNGINTRDYILDIVLPKPRDIVFLTKEALANAVNRRHNSITEQDILDAELRYSEHAFESLVVEASSHLPKAEQVILEFAGSSEIVDLESLEVLLKTVGVDIGRVTDLYSTLVSLSFLGLETDENRFTFMRDNNKNEREKAFVLARKVTTTTGALRFKINRPFHAFLEVSKTN